MTFSLLHKGSFFLLALLVLSLVLGFAKTGTLVELPQADNEENSEDNLECILKVLREFDERRNDTPLPEITHLYDHIQPGVDRNIDINTLLLQYFNLKDISDKETNVQFKPRQMINECGLNLEPALARCKAAYGNSLQCEQVEYGKDTFNKAPFVTPKCPEGYQRYGCCKCVRKCNYTESIESDVDAQEDPKNERSWTKVNYCVKKKAIRSDIKRLNGQERQEIGLTINDYEILEEKEGEYIYVKNCPKDYKRVGNTMCVALCPLGWPDLGNKCLKQGQLVFFPFVWQPGDQKVVPKP
jgi:hypothetical protein